MMSGRKEFIEMLGRYGITPDYALGQNFLWDETLPERMLASAGAACPVNVLEIGAGPGTLTRVLAARARRVIAVEIDPQMEPLLRDLQKTFPSLEVIMGDALRLPLRGLFTPEEKQSLQIIANLPYYITSDLIRKCVTELPEASEMIFLVQKDVLPRLRGEAGDGKSKTKNQGWLSKLISCYGEVRGHMTLPGSCFYPEPRVESRLVSIKRLEQGEVTEVLEAMPGELAKTIEQSFSKRRKTLLNCFPDQADKCAVSAWLTARGLPQSVRAEQLGPAEFASLTRVLCL